MIFLSEAVLGVSFIVWLGMLVFVVLGLINGLFSFLCRLVLFVGASYGMFGTNIIFDVQEFIAPTSIYIVECVDYPMCSNEQHILEKIHDRNCHGRLKDPYKNNGVMHFCQRLYDVDVGDWSGYTMVEYGRITGEIVTGF